MKPKERIGKCTRIVRAAQALHEDDPGWFEGGCADVSETLALAARRAKVRGVRVAYGQARSAGNRPFVPHAWLVVDREVCDPTWDVLFRNTWKRTYKEVPAVKDLLYDKFAAEYWPSQAKVCKPFLLSSRRNKDK